MPMIMVAISTNTCLKREAIRTLLTVRIVAIVVVDLIFQKSKYQSLISPEIQPKSYISSLT
jgi:hypothetical protein